MKIITLKYNREHSAIQKSSLMADEKFCQRHLYRLAQQDTREPEIENTVPAPISTEYIIRGSWQ